MLCSRSRCSWRKSSKTWNRCCNRQERKSRFSTRRTESWFFMSIWKILCMSRPPSQKIGKKYAYSWIKIISNNSIISSKITVSTMWSWRRSKVVVAEIYLLTHLWNAMLLWETINCKDKALLSYKARLPPYKESNILLCSCHCPDYKLIILLGWEAAAVSQTMTRYWRAMIASRR